MGKTVKEEKVETRYSYVTTYDQDYRYTFKLEEGEPIAVVAQETHMRKAKRIKENNKHMTGNVSKDRPRKMFNDIEIELVAVPSSLEGLGHLLDIQMH